MLKGQVSMEFTMIIGFMFFILILFTLGILEKHQELRDQKEFVVTRDIGYKVKDEIILAHTVQPVYTREFSLPNMIESVNYSLNVSGTIVLVWTDDQEFSIRVPAVYGCIHKGTNQVTKYDNGTVIFECI